MSGATISLFVQTDLLSGATCDHPEIVSPEANINHTFTLALNFGKLKIKQGRRPPYQFFSSERTSVSSHLNIA